MESRSGSRTAIIVAIIGAVSVVAAALIANLDDDGSAAPVAAETLDTAPVPDPDPEREAEYDGRVTGEGETSQATPPAIGRTSIVELREEEKADYLGPFEGDYGTQSIGGRTYPDGVSMLVYSDGSGHPKVAVLTEGRFSKITGVVGIDGNAQCIDVPASVSITDDRGATIWGPETVGPRSRLPFSVPLEGAVRIYLTQASLETGEEYCGANPAWGSVYLTGPAKG